MTLLTSLLETHGQELALRLGGILENSVYYFPCSRDVAFTQAVVSRMISQFKECLQEGGTIVTVPEHRLSMLLKFDELCIRHQDKNTIPPTAATFLNLFNLFRRHVVDIVDESDEILRHKYQHEEKVLGNIVHRSESAAKGSACWPHIRLIGDELDDELKRTLIDQVCKRNTNIFYVLVFFLLE